MTTTTRDAPAADSCGTIAGRVVDTCRQAAHVAHEAGRLKTLATDTVDDAVHTARQAIKGVTRRLEDAAELPREAAYRVKRAPFMAVGVAAGIGVAAGFIAGWTSRRLSVREDTRCC